MTPAQIASKLTKAQRAAVIEGRIRECLYNHPEGTCCPICSGWPFSKGGAADFVTTDRAALEA